MSTFFRVALVLVCFSFSVAYGASRAVVISERAIVYSKPSLESKKLGKLRNGKKLKVSSKTKNGFHRVKLKRGLLGFWPRI